MPEYDKIDVFRGDELKTVVFDEKRDCFPELMRFLLEDRPEYAGKICALYGLRRTGKTVLMYQCIRELPLEARQEAAYILCHRGSEVLELRRAMKDLMEDGFRYFFIDEVTYLRDFQTYGNVLSDYFEAKGAKIVIAGTDSLGIRLAEADILFDRVFQIHTSVIPYGEFSRLLGGKTVQEYIEFGGTLVHGPYKPEVFWEDYQNSAIIENILHSLEGSEESRRYGAALTELYSREELVSVINKMINKFSYFVTVKAVEKSYRSAPLYAGVHNMPDVPYDEYLDLAKINQATKRALGIKDKEEMETDLSPRHLEEIKAYLKDLELFLEVPSYESLKQGIRNENLEIFLQPGMVYAHAEKLIQQLEKDETWSRECGISKRRQFLLRTENFVKGILLENIVIAETYLAFRKIAPERYYVSQLATRLPSGEYAEADMIVADQENDEAYLFEIKYSSNSTEEQTRHLRNPNLIRYASENFGQVKGRAVLYNGPDEKEEEEIPYLNAGNFLEDVYSMQRRGEWSFGRWFPEDAERQRDGEEIGKCR